MTQSTMDKIRPFLNWHCGGYEPPAVDHAPPLAREMPADYLAAVAALGPGEGFIGRNYLRLYPPEALPAVNAAYQTADFAPGFVIFGSNGEGDAYAYDFNRTPARIVSICFVPLLPEFAEDCAADFSAFLIGLAGDGEAPPEIDESSIGLETYWLKPIAFGGDPVDEKNIKMAPAKTHAELCVFWTKTYREVMAGKKKRRGWFGRR